MNAITYKEVFPLIRGDQVWLGNGFTKGNAYFATVPMRDYAGGVFDESTGLVKFRNALWFTNIEHGRRHQPLALMTEADNIKFSKHKEVRGVGYQKYDNYDAIEVPFTDSIPSDYAGVMGVPISFLDKYSPEQFEILGSNRWAKTAPLADVYRGSKTVDTDFSTYVNGKETYGRIFIRHRGATK